MGTYIEEANALLKAAYYEPIKVLVWGPGEPPKGSDDRAYKKRVQIKDLILEKFPRSEVYFSEDPEMQKLSAMMKGHLRKEALHAKLSDLVLMLDVSRGADLELDHFVPTYSWFREKVYVFLPEKYVSSKGLVKDVFDYLREDQIEGFTDEEFEKCTLATEKALRIAQSVAITKRMQG